MRRPPFKACSCKYARRIPGGRLCIQSCGKPIIANNSEGTTHRGSLPNRSPLGSTQIPQCFVIVKKVPSSKVRWHTYPLCCVCVFRRPRLGVWGVEVEKGRRHNADRLDFPGLAWCLCRVRTHTVTAKWPAFLRHIITSPLLFRQMAQETIARVAVYVW